MDVAKMQGLIDAIEVESKQASPSHNNLARLTALALQELVKPNDPPVSESTTVSTEATKEQIIPLVIHKEEEAPQLEISGPE